MNLNLSLSSLGGTVDGDGNCEGRDIEIDSDQQLGEQIMFDIRDELRNLLEEDLVPVCPPRSDVSESSGPAPTTPLDDNDDDVVSVLSSAESGFIDDMDEIGELQPVPGGVAVTKSKRKNVGLFIEFGCQEGFTHLQSCQCVGHFVSRGNQGFVGC